MLRANEPEQITYTREALNVLRTCLAAAEENGVPYDSNGRARSLNAGRNVSGMVILFVVVVFFVRLLREMELFYIRNEEVGLMWDITSLGLSVELRTYVLFTVQYMDNVQIKEYNSSIIEVIYICNLERHDYTLGI